MVKKCHICSHVGELTWRNGKYYCAMCGSEISETQPQYQGQQQTNTVVSNAVCPICKNKDNNVFDGTKYRCALCGTSFDLHQESWQPQYSAPYQTGYNTNNTYIQELIQKRNRYRTLGVVFIFLFWPAAVYFFYKMAQINGELKARGY